MALNNFCNIDVDALFEQHNVQTIDMVRKKIHTVAEGKREELRGLVGERYRDLLKAADTITAMQQCSDSLISEVECIGRSCRSLDTNTNWSNESTATTTAGHQLRKYFSTMLQIKLLTTFPEQIWSHIEHERFHSATELLIFGRHISTGLQLDVGNAWLQSLPVAKKQWELLQPLHATIKQNIVAALGRECVRASTVADTLFSLLLLERSNLSTVLKTFLHLRGCAFASTLTDADRLDHEKRRVKERILASLNILYDAIALICECFTEDGLLSKRIAQYTEAKAPPSIQLLDTYETQFSHLLPDIIVKFRPKLNHQSLDRAELQDIIDEWMQVITDIANVHLRQLFDLVATISTIQELKSEMNLRRHESRLVGVSPTHALLQPLNFYEMRYAPFMMQRVHDIIKDNWRRAMDDTFAALKSMLQSPSTAASSSSPDNASYRCMDAQWLWQDTADDLPRSLIEAAADGRDAKKLLMKLRGFDDDIVAIVRDLDVKLGQIASEMNALLLSAEDTLASNDKASLVDFMRTTSHDELTAFVGNVEAHVDAMQCERRQLLLTVRFLTALMELSTHLKASLGQQAATWRPVDTADLWHRVCALIESKIARHWHSIVDGLLDEMANSQEGHLLADITHTMTYADFANWESVTVDQRTEDENLPHSTFRIPSQPRIAVQLYLFNAIKLLTASVPQTLPPPVAAAFNERLLAQVLASYASVSSSTSSSQNASMQLYFDLKFLVSLFTVTRDDTTTTLYRDFEQQCAALKQNIDPFDFAIFEEHLSSNVRKAIARVKHAFGVLIPVAANVSRTPLVPSGPHDKDPNILRLSSNGSSSVWFPLLPVVAAIDMSTMVELKSSPLGSSEKSPKTGQAANASQLKAGAQVDEKGDTARTKTGAVSFFGAMSQDWFR